MSPTPRVAFGLPAYNRPDALAETLESVLGQTCDSFGLVIVDDSTTDATAKVAAAYAAADSRVVYERNPQRLGMVANWRRSFDRAIAHFPGCEYFAWISDHDVWHPRWLEALVSALDADPAAVLAYPIALRTLKNSRPAVNRPFETRDIADPVARLRHASLNMRPGNLIYGLFRTAALSRAGVFRRVLLPDRQVLLEVALLGTFRQVPELLWYREMNAQFSLERQRATLFAGRAPLHTYLPLHLTHAATLAWDLVVRGRGMPAISRLAGLRCAAVQLGSSIQLEMRRTRTLSSQPLGRRAAPTAGDSEPIAEPGVGARSTAAGR